MPRAPSLSGEMVRYHGSDVTPGFPANNGRDRCLRNSSIPSDGPDTFSCSCTFSDPYDVCSPERTDVTFLSSRPTRTQPAPLGTHVGVVVSGSPKKKMIGTDAETVVAFVANEEPWPFTMGEQPGHAVRVLAFSIDAEPTVSLGADSSCPHPAVADVWYVRRDRTGPVDEVPKALLRSSRETTRIRAERAAPAAQERRRHVRQRCAARAARAGTWYCGSVHAGKLRVGQRPGRVAASPGALQRLA